ncbi:hypothetical protein Aple_014310 [Acrocarpospora pleiomorpha]|uniref:PBP domain-containing protein n=1 Tax=Acrocarpospora pleiomorpha TaxID=90975 RepID=A0A5M3XD04_9ACTN|nr:substrate-binding domain-containing protein [Acrocarpospora pleiomorpha]GES18536.1 hypothetical protein Aple_014310 [Acrocarpospora pleiomorpha]
MSTEIQSATPGRLRRLARRLGAVAVAAVTVSALATPAWALPDFADGKMNSVIRGSGSDTTYFAMQAMDAAFNGSPGCELVLPPNTPQYTCLADLPTTVLTENYDHEVGLSQFPQGSGAGLRQLCQQNDGPTGGLPAGVSPISYARSSSSVSSIPSTCNTGDQLRYVGWAKDAIAIAKWLGGASGPVTNLTHAQLQEIFRDVSGDGCAEDWGDFGGTPGTQIKVHGIQTSSGTYATITSFLGGDANACVAATGGQVLFENDCTEINNLGATDRGASIWPLSFGKYSTGAANCTDAATDLISVGGIAATPTTIQNSTYQYNRTLYNVYRRGGPGWIEGYIGENGWICKPNAAHSKKVGDTNPGLPNANVDRNWGLAIDKVITDAGFVKVNATGNKCNFVNFN